MKNPHHPPPVGKLVARLLKKQIVSRTICKFFLSVVNCENPIQGYITVKKSFA